MLEDGRGCLGTAGDGRPSMGDIWWWVATDIVNNIPTRKRGGLNRLSSAVSVGIKLNESFCYESYFSFTYFSKDGCRLLTFIVE